MKYIDSELTNAKHHFLMAECLIVLHSKSVAVNFMEAYPDAVCEKAECQSNVQHCIDLINLFHGFKMNFSDTFILLICICMC